MVSANSVSGVNDFVTTFSSARRSDVRTRMVALSPKLAPGCASYCPFSFLRIRS